MNNIENGGRTGWTSKTPSKNLNRTGIKMGGVKATTVPPNSQVVKQTVGVSKQNMHSNPPPVPSRDTPGYRRLIEGTNAQKLKNLDSSQPPQNSSTVKTEKIAYTIFEKLVGVISTKKKEELQQKRTVKEEVKNLQEFDMQKDSQQVQKSSLILGRSILKPSERNDPTERQRASERLEKGITYPGKCMEDLWRLANKFSIHEEGSDIPLVSQFTPDKETKNEELTEQTAKILNALYKHANKEGDTLVKGSDVNVIMGKKSKNDKSFEEICTNKGLKDNESMKMQKMLGLGGQELWTRAMGESVIPQDYKNGKDGITVAEFRAGGNYGPFESNRTVSITLKKDGGLDVRISQPVTFRKSSDDEIIGTCRCVTTYGFDKNMNCINMKQELGTAEILQDNN